MSYEIPRSQRTVLTLAFQKFSERARSRPNQIQHFKREISLLTKMGGPHESRISLYEDRVKQYTLELDEAENWLEFYRTNRQNPNESIVRQLISGIPDDWKPSHSEAT